MPYSGCWWLCTINSRWNYLSFSGPVSFLNVFIIYDHVISTTLGLLVEAHYYKNIVLLHFDIYWIIRCSTLLKYLEQRVVASCIQNWWQHIWSFRMNLNNCKKKYIKFLSFIYYALYQLQKIWSNEIYLAYILHLF